MSIWAGNYRWIVTGLAVGTLATACQSAPPPPTPINPTQTSAAISEPPTQAPLAAPVDQTQVPASEPAVAGQTQLQVPTSEPVAAPVEVRRELAATDPATVDLANGTPSLVEFFAFW